MAEHPIAGPLRKSVIEDPQSFKRLATEVGVSRQTLMRFADGVGTLRLDHAETLCRYYGLELTRKTRLRDG
ncbi:helix-turn-helix domain-containing protein [Botrimarina sp.]|uniref:helix-turn-helix domain-containing protein n=1 Tax=Botrimarina sp. TaxID=2795802 RepID=UPI0032ED9192